MRFMYVFAFAHTYKGKMFTPQSGGELNPIEIKNKGGKKSIAVDIKINTKALKLDLEGKQIIRKFGF